MKTFNKTYLGFIILFAMYSCQTNSANDTATPPPMQENITAQTFKTETGWGYAIFINDKIFIKQSFIPAIAGNKGFANEADANKVAVIVVTKLKKHEKPIVRLNELIALGIAGENK
jgi:hypothetical protein